jgi:hypothetical protein
MVSEIDFSSLDNLGDDFAIVVVTSSGRLEDTGSDLVKKMVKRSNMCLYVAVNQPYSRMMTLLKKKDIDTSRVFFIDCITETSGGKAERVGNCVYVNSPGNLTELGIAISQALQAISGSKFLFMDALSTLVIYNNPNTFAKFAHFIMTRVKVLGINGIFMIVEKELEEELMTRITQFSDRVIRLN